MSIQPSGSSRGLWRISSDRSIDSDRSSDVSDRLSAGGCEARPAASRRSALFSNSRQAQSPTMKPTATPANESAITHTSTSVGSPGKTRRVRMPAIMASAWRIATARTGTERDAHQRRASPNPRGEHRDHAGEQQHGRRLAEWNDHGVHEARLGAEHHEGVGRAIPVAAGPGRGRRVGVHEQHRRQVEESDEQHAGGDQGALGPGRQPAGREREHEEDEKRLDEPSEHTARAVEHVAARLRKRRERPRETGDHQQLREPRPRIPVPHVQADGDRKRDDRGADLCFQERDCAIGSRRE